VIEEVFPKNNKKVMNAWALFDWANSSYALVITVAIFPVYFLATTDDQLPLGGTMISNSALYAFAITFSYFTIAIIAPCCLASQIPVAGGKCLCRFLPGWGLWPV
jgi:MFS transporter, UMF1 family